MLDARSNQGNIGLTVNGALQQQSWEYQLASGTLEYPELAPWILNKPAVGMVSAERTSIEDACFSSAKAELLCYRSADRWRSVGKLCIEETAIELF